MPLIVVHLNIYRVIDLQKGTLTFYHGLMLGWRNFVTRQTSHGHFFSYHQLEEVAICLEWISEMGKIGSWVLFTAGFSINQETNRSPGTHNMPAHVPIDVNYTYIVV